MARPAHEALPMSKRLAFPALLAVLGVAALACTAGSGDPALHGSTDAQRQATITAPTSGLVVTATISAVTLGDECAGVATPGSSFAGTCAPAPTPDGGADSAKAAPSNGCGTPTSYCQQSNVQIAFTAGAGTRNAKIEVVDVTLYDVASGKVVDVLKSSHPQVWSGNGYAAWNEQLTPSTDLKASYDLSAPAWSTINGTSSARTTSTYSAKYKVYVTLRIDGVVVTLLSTDLSREPAVAT